MLGILGIENDLSECILYTYCLYTRKSLFMSTKPSINLPYSVENLISEFDESGRYTYFPVGIKIVGIAIFFVAKRFQCLHLLRTIFGRYKACFSMKIISMPTVVLPNIVGIKTVGIKIGHPSLVVYTLYQE